MRNFSLISILLALAIGAFIWQKQFKHQVPTRMPDPVELAPAVDYRGSEYEIAEDCEDAQFDSDECEPGREETVQSEMEDQRKRAYGTIMKSFDDEYGKYREQTGGRP
jgi:hypothetical protein